VAVLSVGALSCSGDPCTPLPCPAPGFDSNTCACAAGSAQAGAGGAQTGTPETAACDPLSAQTSAVMLTSSDIIAAGRDPSDQSVYVLVGRTSPLRLFVTGGDTLMEVFESGTGQGSTDSGRFWTFAYEDQQAMPITVEVQEDASGERMGVVKGALLGKGFDVGSTGDVLDAIDSASAALMPAASRQTFHVEFSATDAGGQYIVVIAPDHASNFDGFRVFYGPLAALAEQSGMVSVTRGLSIPSTTSIAFMLDGTPATLQYGAAGDVLSVGASEAPLTALATSPAPAGAMFQCLRQK